MDLAEVVVSEVQRNGMRVHFDLLAEPVGQSREAAHVHTHREVLTFDVARRNVATVGIARDGCARGADEPSGRIARARIVADRFVSFLEHRVIDIAAERKINGGQIMTIAVGGELHATGQTRRHVTHEVVRDCLRPCTDRVRHDQFGIGINRGPRPAVAPFAALFFGNVLRLRADEAPNFIALNSLALEIANRSVMVRRARRAKIAQQLFNRHPRDASQTRRRSQTVSFNQCGDNGGALLPGQLIHNGHYACSCR